jgi:pyruvate decarboxylase
MHHMIENGNPEVYANVYKNFTVGQIALHQPRNAPTLIDNNLRLCIQRSRPVYFSLPSDTVGARVDSSALSTPLDLSHSIDSDSREDEAVDAVLEKIYAAKQPYILVDGLVAPNDIVDEVNQFAKVTGIPTLSLTFGGGIIDGTLPNYHGVHTGRYGSLDFTPYTDTADLALLFGPLLSDTNTMGWSTIPPNYITVQFRRTYIKIFGENSKALHIKSAMRKLLDRLDVNRLTFRSSKAASLPSVRELAKSLPTPDPEAPIDQDTFYLRISSFFRSGDIILCANGTPLAGGRDFVLPPKTKLINSSVWVSVGQMLPATQGVALAKKELGDGGRTILFEGDGSFQATAQELSTIIRYKLDAYIFLINNDGYTYERLIHGMDAEYNDVAPWNYLKAPEMMGAPTDGSYDVELHDVGTWGELDAVLKNERFHNGKGLKMVNVRMARGDVTKNFKAALKAVGDQLRSESPSTVE